MAKGRGWRQASHAPCFSRGSARLDFRALRGLKKSNNYPPPSPPIPRHHCYPCPHPARLCTSLAVRWNAYYGCDINNGRTFRMVFFYILPRDDSFPSPPPKKKRIEWKVFVSHLIPKVEVSPARSCPWANLVSDDFHVRNRRPHLERFVRKEIKRQPITERGPEVEQTKHDSYTGNKSGNLQFFPPWKQEFGLNSYILFGWFKSISSLRECDLWISTVSLLVSCLLSI